MTDTTTATSELQGVFRPLPQSEVEDAHAIVAEVTDWLNKRGIVQWSSVVPIETYRARQVRGENFGLFEPGLTAVVTLAPTIPDRWSDRAFDSPFLWLSTLASRRDSRGAGRRAVAAAIAHAKIIGRTALYLDCVDRDDALPSFYRSAGFTMRERRVMHPEWPMCLFEMRFD